MPFCIFSLNVMGILCKLFVLEQCQNWLLLDECLCFSFSVLVGLLCFLRRNLSSSKVIKVLGSLINWWPTRVALKCVSPRPVVVPSPTNLLEMQMLRPLLDPWNQKPWVDFSSYLEDSTGACPSSRSMGPEHMHSLWEIKRFCSLLLNIYQRLVWEWFGMKHMATGDRLISLPPIFTPWVNDLIALAYI